MYLDRAVGLLFSSPPFRDDIELILLLRSKSYLISLLVLLRFRLQFALLLSLHFVNVSDK